MEPWLTAIVLTAMCSGTALIWRVIGLFGKRGRLASGEAARLERIEEQLALLIERRDDGGADSRVAELEERLDFAERVLIQGRADLDRRPVTPV